MKKIALVAGILFLAAGVFLIWQQKDTSIASPDEHIAASTTSENKLFEEQFKASYYAQFNYPKYKIRSIKTGEGPMDGIVGVGTDGAEHELVPVQILARPLDGETIIYYSFKPGTDAGAWPYFSFNQKTGELKILKTVSSKIDSAYPQKERLSPDGKYYAAVGSDMETPGEDASLFKTLYLLDLKADTARAIKVLADSDTFVIDFSTWAGGPRSDIKWIDNNTLQYSVYDSHTKVAGNDPDGPSGATQHPLLRVETVSI